MKFGKTWGEEQELINNSPHSSNWFAWYPVLLISGQYAWLENVIRFEYYVRYAFELRKRTEYEEYK